MTVPFLHVLPQVAKRDTELRGGLAFLRCDQIPTYTIQVFVGLLEWSSERMRATGCLGRIRDDPRFQDILTTLKGIYEQSVPSFPLDRQPLGSLGRVNLGELDGVAAYFPPCMRAIHYTLRTRHRLCHRPRVQYTLYLKDIGLPVHEFLQLLEHEYSKPPVQTDPNQTHNCEHSWARDHRRYIYGTKHLYGMMGVKKNYSSHGCRTIQVKYHFYCCLNSFLKEEIILLSLLVQGETPGPNHCGGCPFAHFDKENLRKFLEYDLGGREEAEGLMKEIEGIVPLKPIEACHTHLRFKAKRLVLSKSQNPTQDLKVLENSQVKIHAMLRPKHYFSVLSKLLPQPNPSAT